MKEYIQIDEESFNTFSFSSIFMLNCSLADPEKEGGRVVGLDGLRLVIVPQFSSCTRSAMPEEGDLENLKIFG